MFHSEYRLAAYRAKATIVGISARYLQVPQAANRTADLLFREMLVYRCQGREIKITPCIVLKWWFLETHPVNLFVIIFHLFCELFFLIYDYFTISNCPNKT